MPKRFEDFQTDKKNYSDFKERTPVIDPNFSLNEIAYQEIIEKRKALHSTLLSTKTFLSVLFAPLTTIQVSLQLSVIPHQNKYGDMNQFESKEVMKVPKELTPYEKRRYELIVKSGVTGGNQPFRAPVYLTYKEAFKALSNQGLLGFYKGNLLGLCYTYLNSGFKFSLMNSMDFKRYTNPTTESLLFKTIFAVFSLTIIDTISHPFMLMQSRFILQNRLPSFRTYHSLFHFFKKHIRRPGVFLQGASIYLPKNLLFLIGHINLSQNFPLASYVIAQTIAETLAYPFFTASRRIQCQDKLAGMLPERYTGIRHALRLIMYEEGIRGLYRGYFAFLPMQLISSLAMITMKIAGERSFDYKRE